MGACFSKKRHSNSKANGHGSAPAGRTGYQQIHQSYQKPAANYNPSPQAHHAPPQPPAPAPQPPQSVTVQKLEPNNILGKPFEDLKSKYSIGKELGRGQFRRKLVSKSDKDDMKREVQIMQHLSGQPNIVEFKGAFEDRQTEI